MMPERWVWSGKSFGKCLNRTSMENVKACKIDMMTNTVHLIILLMIIFHNNKKQIVIVVVVKEATKNDFFPCLQRDYSCLIISGSYLNLFHGYLTQSVEANSIPPQHY